MPLGAEVSHVGGDAPLATPPLTWQRITSFRMPAGSGVPAAPSQNLAMRFCSSVRLFLISMSF
jgi:hypothetical protein